MTISDAARRAGISNQAIYKRLKARGISPESIREQGTSKLTAEGEKIIKELFPAVVEYESRLGAKSADDHAAAQSDEVDRLTTENKRLTKEVNELTTRLTTAEERAIALQDERDYLRGALEKSQQLQALTAQKIPNPPPALTEGSEEKQKRGLLARLIGRGRS